MHNWTEEQKTAIKTVGGKIIVSAAAGSGKTTVLAQRVINHIKNNISIDQLLIVTFTKAAANEMKEKIKENLEEFYNKDKTNEHIKKQIVLLESADITTMDAFYYKLVNNNFHLLDIMPNFNVLSLNELKLIENKCIKEVLDNEFNKNKDEYIEVLNILNAQDVSLIKDIVLSVSNFLDSKPFEEEYLNEVLESYSPKNITDFNSSIWANNFYNDIAEKLSIYKSIISQCENSFKNEDEKFDKVTEQAGLEVKKIDEFINLLNERKLNEFLTAIRLFSFARSNTPRNQADNSALNKYKEIRKELKNYLENKLIISLSGISEETFKEDLFIYSKVLKRLFSIVTEYRSQLLIEKKKINGFSFSDVQHFVIKLLVNENKHTKFAKEFKEKYYEILIDECQDTNQLQNIIFKALSKNEENLFMVGDIKQSIYRFRDACPDLFNKEKQDAKKDSFPKLLLLSKNFRSNNAVINICNYIFESLMSRPLGETLYNEEEKLHPGLNIEGNEKDVTEFYILSKEKKSDEDEDLSDEQKEAIFVAERIKKLFDDKYQILEKGKYRDIKESDIAVLFKKRSSMDIYRRALLKRNLNSFCENKTIYFDNYEVKVVIALLQIIDNPYINIPLVTVLSSPLFNFKIEELVEIRSNNKYDFVYDNLKNSTKYTKKINLFLEKIIEFSEYSLNNKLSNLIAYIYKELDVISLLTTNNNSERTRNLIQMIEHAVEFEQTSTSLGDFTNYILDIINNKESLQGSNPLPENENILLTTIHSSKGLEYPVVFIVQTGKKFNEQELNNDFIIDSDLGISFRIKNINKLTKRDTLPIIEIKNNIKKKELSEELRVLYVALTRAKQKIIITGITNNLENTCRKLASRITHEKKLNYQLISESSIYLEWLILAMLRHKDGSILRKLANIDVKTVDTNSNVLIEEVDLNLISNKEFDEMQVEKQCKETLLGAVYKTNKAYIPVPQSIAVSNIRIKSTSYIRKPDFITKQIDGAKLGTLYHRLLEVLPFIKYTKEELNKQINILLNKNILNKDDIKVIDIDKIYNFFSSDLYNDILKSKEVYKEYNINFFLPANIYNKELSSKENILVQGIIDLFFVIDNTYYIIDYKSDRVTMKKELIDRYKLQLELYSLAISNKYNTKKVKRFLYSTELNEFIEV